LFDSIVISLVGEAVGCFRECFGAVFSGKCWGIGNLGFCKFYDFGSQRDGSGGLTGSGRKVRGIH